MWLGEADLKGKTILLYGEQGLGDTIQFVRLVPEVAARGARVVLEVQPALRNLVGAIEGVKLLVSRGDPLPVCDFHCPLMSLPLAFKTDLDTIPVSVPYLFSEPTRVALWHSHLGPKTRPRVGVVWSGNPGHKNDHNRSMNLSDFVADMPNEFDFYSLQTEIRSTDLSVLNESSIRPMARYINDFTDTAALCHLMDVVITVDTSLAHLSGAMGKPTWVLLPYVPDWRWLLNRNDSPWYDSVTLYRQDSDRSYAPVIRKVFSDLQNVFIQNEGRNS